MMKKCSRRRLQQSTPSVLVAGLLAACPLPAVDVADAGVGVDAGPEDPFAPAPGDWPMFKREPHHNGNALDLVGEITAANVCERWTRQVSGANRGSSGPVIVRIGGVPRVVLAAQGSCVDGTCTGDAPGTMWMLDGSTGAIALQTRLPADAQADPYGPVALDVDGDGARELVVPSLDDNRLFLFRLEDEPDGVAGSLQWTFTYDADGRSETGPVAVNLDDDPALEIVFGTDFDPNPGIFFVVDGATGEEQARLAVRRRSTVSAACDTEPGSGNSKADSASPAAALIDGEMRVFGGAWDGRLYSLALRQGELVAADVDELPLDGPEPCPVRKVRNGPVIAPLGPGGDLVVAFGHMAELDGDAQFESARLRVVNAGDLSLIGELDQDIWKSSLSVGPLLQPGNQDQVLVAGRYRGAFAARVDGGAVVEQWSADIGDGTPFGSNRSSPAVGDLDGDGDVEVVVGVEGNDGSGLLILQGATGEEFLRREGADVAGAPALGDVDGDGRLEIVYFDTAGFVHVLDSSCP